MLEFTRRFACTVCVLPVFAAALHAQTRPVAPRPTAGASPQRETASATFALTHVSVVDVERGQVSHDNTVVVSGNRIAGVGPNARIPTAARTIKARGRVLIPGLWDMQSHSLDRWEWSSLLNVANAVTGVRDPAAVKPVHEIVALRDSVERGQTFGPRFVASGRIIDGSPKSRGTYVAIDSPHLMRAEMQQRQRDGLDFIKVYTRLSRDVFMAEAEEARRLGIPLDGHGPLTVTAAEASDAGMRRIEQSYRHRMSCATAEDEIRRLLRDLITIGALLDDHRYTSTEDWAFVLGLNTYSPEKCRQLGERFARNGTRFVPTLVEMQTRFVSEDPLGPEFEKRLTDPRLRYVSVASWPIWCCLMRIRWRTLPIRNSGSTTPDDRRVAARGLHANGESIQVGFATAPFPVPSRTPFASATTPFTSTALNPTAY
ncbi:MAG: hypothetical protein H7Z40_08795 [Phycisphaerae bacterium]|nr:hypothetical protein [Gemmatimonadaceae bacterium]